VDKHAPHALRLKPTELRHRDPVQVHLALVEFLEVFDRAVVGFVVDDSGRLAGNDVHAVEDGADGLTLMHERGLAFVPEEGAGRLTEQELGHGRRLEAGFDAPAGLLSRSSATGADLRQDSMAATASS